MSRELFGTDGIRGVAGTYPLDDKTANAVGAALGKWVTESRQERQIVNRQIVNPQVVNPQVVIGMDTRESGPWLAAEVAGGLAGEGVASDFAGVTTTPGVAFLAKNGPFAAGVHRIRDASADWARHEIRRCPPLYRTADQILRRFGRIA